jgi:glutamate-5-semialdehyde dehydrogenase
MKDVLEQLEGMNAAKLELRCLPAELKNNVLLQLQKKLVEHTDRILAANTQDVVEYEGSPKFQKAFLDRLTLTAQRIQQMAESLKVIVQLKDPVGEIVESRVLANGLKLQKSRSPLGLIFLIFEARPNVITEAFSLALKSGNALILKGGKESERTSAVIYQLIQDSLAAHQVNLKSFWGLLQASRDTTDFLIKQHRSIDVLIPRGGDHLIEYVTHHATIPIIKNDRGLCHIYIHEKADLNMALSILDNAKTQRPSVCNAAETLLIDRTVASTFLPAMHLALVSKGVVFYGCTETMAILAGKSGVHLISLRSYDTEYLDLKLNIKVVTDLGEAVRHIERHGSRHSEAIVTAAENVAMQFLQRVDAAVVYWNASTRFTDGGQLGLGAEIGVSTQKLHVRGPVGLEALTSLRWIISGDGQTRPG